MNINHNGSIQKPNSSSFLEVSSQSGRATDSCNTNYRLYKESPIFKYIVFTQKINLNKKIYTKLNR